MIRWVARIVTLLVWSAVAAYFVWADGWKDATTGRFHRLAHEMFWEVSDIAEVRIYRLKGEEGQKTEQKFYLGATGWVMDTYGSVTVKGNELATFLRDWQGVMANPYLSMMCHDPAYAFELENERGQVRQTTVCWGCNNFSVLTRPGHWNSYGFDPKTAQGLLEFCDKRLPYKRDPPKESTQSER